MGGSIMIYRLYNYGQQSVEYICPDQITIDEGKKLGYSGIFVIGTEADATVAVASSRQAWLTANEYLFTTNKDIDPDPIQTTWLVCDLNTEPQNNNVDYNVFDVINGYYNLTTGLDAAKQLLNDTKVNATEFFIVDYYAFKTWPKTNVISEGLQTL